MDEDTELPPEGDGADEPPEDIQEPPAVKPKPDKVPYASYKHQKDEKERLNRRVQELTNEKTERESAGQSESQKLQKQLDAALAELNATRTELRSTKVDRQVEAVAKNLNFRDPEDALHLVRTRLEVEEDGTVVNAEDLLEQLAKSKPYLLTTKEEPAPKAPAPKAPAAKSGAAANPGGTPKSLTRQDLVGMKPAEIMERFKKGEFNELIKAQPK